jgi:hypothetical protein
MQAKPRAYEPHRLVDAIRGHTRVLAVVALLALFGGAAVARWMVPDLQRATVHARVGFEPHAVLARAHGEALLAAAATRAGEATADLARRVRVSFQGGDQLSVEVRGSEAEQPGKLAAELASGYVALANSRADVHQADQQGARVRELARLRALRDQAQAQLARETPPELVDSEAQLRAQLAELEASLQAASVSPSSEPPLARAAPRAPARTSADLVAAQKSLSKLLAQGGSDGEVSALRAKIAKLQRAASAGDTAPRASAARMAALNARIGRTRAELLEASAQLGSLREAVHRAESTLEEASARALPSVARAELAGPVRVQPISRRPLRVVVALLAPVLALFMLVGLLILRELNDLRVCEATEVAHWLGVTVLTSSPWPRRNDALESLVDVLADPALASLGTTLVLPLSEIERPLAYTLTAQLNARAQRHFLSRTGSRVTIAQDWHGELDSSRIERAAEAADRVLWVVAADAHRGQALAAQRALVKRTDGVAAVLVDAEPVSVRSVGAVLDFWNARAHKPEPLGSSATSAAHASPL